MHEMENILNCVPDNTAFYYRPNTCA